MAVFAPGFVLEPSQRAAEAEILRVLLKLLHHAGEVTARRTLDLPGLLPLLFGRDDREGGGGIFPAHDAACARPEGPVDAHIGGEEQAASTTAGRLWSW